MRRYINSLDGIRGFGIFFVICYHFIILSYTPEKHTILGFSWIWIQMFFVQSGYLITDILINTKHKPFKIYAGQFYWRRMLRIFPVYFMYIIAFAALYLVFHKPEDFGDRAPYLFSFTYNYTRLFSHIDFFSPDGIWFMHFWSLAVEEQFYLVWPFLIYFLDEKRIKILIVFMIFAVPVFRFWFTDYILASGYAPKLAGEITYAFTLSQFDAFMIGAAIPIFRLRERIQQPGKWALIALLVVLGAGLTNYLLLRNSGHNIHWASLGISVADVNNFQHVWSYSLINILFALVILYLIRDDYKGIFENNWLVSIGKIVYGMYIYHFAILYVMSKVDQKLIHSFPVTFGIAFVMIYVLSYISYNYFEKKFLALKDYWPKLR
jgi:peptidoglycan/LPS O-acetylase OafA/YrhL